MQDSDLATVRLLAMIRRQCLAPVSNWPAGRRLPSVQRGKPHGRSTRHKFEPRKPPCPSSPFPRPRLNLKHFTILAAVWAVPNAIAAWILRGGYVTGTAAQIRQLTVDAFLGVNLVLGFFGIWIAVNGWAMRVVVWKRNGGRIPTPRQRQSLRQSAAVVGIAILMMVPLSVWGAIAGFFVFWMTPRIWPIQQFSVPLWGLIVLAPFVPLVVSFLAKNHEIGARVRQRWKSASGTERVSVAMAFLWFIGFFLAMTLGGPSLHHWGFVRWFPIPPFLLIFAVGQLALMAAIALSMRWR